MNTMLGNTVGQDTDVSGRVLQSLLLLVRNFMTQTDAGKYSMHAGDAQQFISAVPPRVWRRHSALLSLLVQQADTDATGSVTDK